MRRERSACVCGTSDTEALVRCEMRHMVQRILKQFIRCGASDELLRRRTINLPNKQRNPFYRGISARSKHYALQTAAQLQFESGARGQQPPRKHHRCGSRGRRRPACRPALLHRRSAIGWNRRPCRVLDGELGRSLYATKSREGAAMPNLNSCTSKISICHCSMNQCHRSLRIVVLSGVRRL